MYTNNDLKLINLNNNNNNNSGSAGPTSNQPNPNASPMTTSRGADTTTNHHHHHRNSLVFIQEKFPNDDLKLFDRSSTASSKLTTGSKLARFFHSSASSSTSPLALIKSKVYYPISMFPSPPPFFLIHDYPRIRTVKNYAISRFADNKSMSRLDFIIFRMIDHHDLLV